MSPREAKPPAVPIRMPRTEKDIDRLFSAIEEHEAKGHQIGQAINEGKMTRKEALIRAGKRDEKLYDIRDAIMQERAEQRDEEIAQENPDAAA